MTERPLVFITGNPGTDSRGCPTATCLTSYVEAVAAVGGLPVVLPPLEDVSAAAALRGACDGLLFSGGADLGAETFGASPHAQLNPLSPVRQKWDLELMRRALEWDDVPLLAICLGVQELNVALGGTLHQHVPDLPGRLEHRKPGGEEQMHPVTVLSGTSLADVLQQTDIIANSFHHQALDRLGKGLRVSATAPDGTVEAVELTRPRGRFLLAVQWHPERIIEAPAHRRIFEAFVEACRKRHAQRCPIAPAARPGARRQTRQPPRSTDRARPAGEM